MLDSLKNKKKEDEQTGDHENSGLQARVHDRAPGALAPLSAMKF